jgi:hypothetical protein
MPRILVARRGGKVEAITVIMAALVAGTSAGVSDTVSTAVRDAYSGLRDAVRRRLTARTAGDATEATDVMLADPQGRHGQLAQALAESGAAEDVGLIAAAQDLLRLTDPDGAAAGKYVVDLRESRGSMVGDYNVQVNKFS